MTNADRRFLTNALKGEHLTDKSALIIYCECVATRHRLIDLFTNLDQHTGERFKALRSSAGMLIDELYQIQSMLESTRLTPHEEA